MLLLRKERSSLLLNTCNSVLINPTGQLSYTLARCGLGGGLHQLDLVSQFYSFCYISELLRDDKLKMASNNNCSENVFLHTKVSKDDMKDINVGG